MGASQQWTSTTQQVAAQCAEIVSVMKDYLDWSYSAPDISQ